MTEKNLIELNGEKELKVTTLGRATLKGMVDLDQANALYYDLHLALESLNVETDIYLMYLVTPYDMVGSVFPIAPTYFQVKPWRKNLNLFSLKNKYIVLKRLGIRQVVRRRVERG